MDHYVAYLTPEFGELQKLDAALDLDNQTLTLTGTVSFNTGGMDQTVNDGLAIIVLPIGSDGKLAGTFTASGQENVFEGDVGWAGDATASGVIGPDVRAPQIRASAIASATSVLLPWDALNVRASEPVGLQGAATLSTASGDADVNWELGTKTSSLDAVSMMGYRASWSDFSGSATLEVGAGLRDPSNNLSSAVATQLTFLDVPKGVAFSGTTPPAMWGATQVVTGSDSCGTASSCIEIGPLDGPCATQPGGLAARLDATSGTTIAVTYRMRVASQYIQPYFGTGFDVATPGKAAQPASDPNLTAPFAQTTDATYNYATDWVTAKLAVPASGEVGLALDPFGNASMYCNGGPAMPPVKLIVDVASISVE